MTGNFKNDIHAIQEIIDSIPSRAIHEPDNDIQFYTELLTLSQHCNHLYGQALAHINLAQCYQIIESFEPYAFHVKRAKSIAEQNDFNDVLLDYYNMEGFQCIDSCDELTAISLYSQGIYLAKSTKNLRLCACFYNNIAEIFSDNYAFDEAENYYLKALHVQQKMDSKKSRVNLKTTLINLSCLACRQKDAKKARKYFSECLEIDCPLHIMPLMEHTIEIHILTLENHLEKAFLQMDILYNEITHSLFENITLQPVYIYIMEVLLNLKYERYATWCINQLLTAYHEVNPSIALRIQKLRVDYHQLYHKDTSSLYEDFFNAAMNTVNLQRHAIAESFKSFISLYETEKEQSTMEKEREFLQSTIDTDELTGLNNRRYFNKLFSKCLHDDRIQMLGYVMIDVDNFKKYNDYYGHAKGDKILKEVARALYKNLPSNAYATRYGGDEFACFFINTSDEAIIHFVTLVQQTIEALQIEHIYNESIKRITLSFGINNEHMTDINMKNELIKKADLALYEAKKLGRNTYVLFKEDKDTLVNAM